MDIDREAEYILDGARRDISAGRIVPESQIEILETCWKDLKTVLNRAAEDVESRPKSCMTQEEIYEYFDDKAIRSQYKFKNLMAAAGSLEVIHNVRSDSGAKNKYDLERYRPELLEAIGRQLEGQSYDPDWERYRSSKSVDEFIKSPTNRQLLGIENE